MTNQMILNKDAENAVYNVQKGEFVDSSKKRSQDLLILLL